MGQAFAGGGGDRATVGWPLGRSGVTAYPSEVAICLIQPVSQPVS